MNNTRFFVSDFVEIQRNSFNTFLEKGIISEITRRNPIYIRRDNSSIFEIRFYPEYYKLTTPVHSVEKAIIAGKSYTSDFFVPIQLTEYELGNSLPNIAIDLTAEIPTLPIQADQPQPEPQPSNTSGRKRAAVKPRGRVAKEASSVIEEGPNSSELDSLEKKETRSSALHSGYSGIAEHPTGDHGFGLKIKRTCFQWINLCQFPLMTKRGHFIINGSPRVIVNQVLRSPGIYFQQKEYQTFNDQWTIKPKEVLIRYYTDIICFRGTWLRIAIDRKNRMWAQTKRHPKIPLYSLLLSMGLTLRQLSNSLSYPERLFENFKPEEISTLGLRSRLEGKVAGQVPLERYSNIQWIENPPEAWEFIYNIQNPNKISSGRRSSVSRGQELLRKFPVEERTDNTIPDALLPSIVSNRLENIEKGRQWVFNKFMNPRTYELRKQGRTNINTKFQLNIPSDQQTLTAQDLLATTEYLIQIEKGVKTVDNIDHLKNRRVRTVGELIQVQLGIGLLRFEKYVRTAVTLKSTDEIFGEPQVSLSESNVAKLSTAKSFSATFFGDSAFTSHQTNSHSDIHKPRALVSLISNSAKGLAKPVNGALREFFGTSPLSQLMDQMNPLAELTHKRRLTSLGPGGVSRDNATLDIRGIHPSHYGRICPIETPEGKNTGLVNSITTYAFVNETGTIYTPYYRVYKGQIQKEAGFYYLTAEKEDLLTLAAGDVGKSTVGFFPNNNIPIRQGPRFTKIPAKEVQYIAVSAIQMISVAASLIPFLEHDDANRALMGSNMQRQSVPLLRPTRPIVATGLECKVIADSGHVIHAKQSGIVTHVSGSCIQLSSLTRPFQR